MGCGRHVYGVNTFFAKRVKHGVRDGSARADGAGFAAQSAPVRILTTPGAASAFDVSTRLIAACATEERNIQA